MRIGFVSIAGADDSTDVEAMAAFSEQNKKVWWGFALSRRREGTARYPSYDWLLKLGQYPIFKDRLVGHLCGQYVYDLFEGNFSLYKNRKELLGFIRRFQVNVKGVVGKPGPDFIPTLKYFSINHYDPYPVGQPQKLNVGGNPLVAAWFFQCLDDEWSSYYRTLLRSGVVSAPLLDRSAGEGVLPGEWHYPIENDVTVNGYAGGLSPDNLAEQLKKIEQKVGDGHIFIDMESGVRTQNRLDLSKVERVMEICQPYF